MKINQELVEKQSKKIGCLFTLRQPINKLFWLKDYASSLERPAFKYSLFNLAMLATEMPFGHSASHA